MLLINLVPTLAINCGQSKMKNNTDAIPWSVYRGIGLDGQDEEGLEEPGLTGQELREDEEQGEVETADRDNTAGNGALAALEKPSSVVPLSRRGLLNYIKSDVSVKGNRLACHAIVFAHDSPEVASATLGSDAMFEFERLQNTPLKIYLVNKPRNFDPLSYGHLSIFARPWVIHQWLVVGCPHHPHYQSITAPDSRELER
jgi:hypothetical protein